MLNKSLVAIAVILTLSACQSTPKKPINSENNLAQAYALLQRAQSTASDTQGAQLRIQAADLFINEGKYSDGLNALAPLASPQIPPELPENSTLRPLTPLDAGLSKTQDQQRKASTTRLRAAAYFGLGQTEQARYTLTQLEAWRAKDMRLLSNICETAADYACSADALIQFSMITDQAAGNQSAKLNNEIWMALTQAHQSPAAFINDEQFGWWSLHQQMRQASSVTAQISVWTDWQNRHLDHPARANPPEALRLLDAYTPPKIGLFLPLSGTYGAAGRAVRDGLIAAYMAEKNSTKPLFEIYDTQQSSLAALYEQAMRAQMDVLVGPLIQSNVEQFAKLTESASIPRLVLNYLSSSQTESSEEHRVPEMTTSTYAPLFQFGIAIEDEAEALASSVALRGLRRLLVVHSQQPWAVRAQTEYLKHWPFDVTIATFEDIKDLTASIGKAMLVADSNTRKSEIANIVGQPLEFLARARTDLDGIVAFTNQVESRALIPALNFHFANHLPVFATSQSARGGNLESLAGIEITEMPLYAAPNDALRNLTTVFSLENNAFGELYALGYDIYSLATWLPLLEHNSQITFAAASGNLRLHNDGKFRRELALSRILRNGKLTPSQ